MTDPCCTINKVINTYEKRNRTVSNGNRVRFFFGTSTGAATGTAVEPNEIVKWHPV